MPTYLGRVEVDWGWQELDERERGLVRLAEARLQADAHSITYELLVETLSEASRQLAGRELCARFDGVASPKRGDDEDGDADDGDGGAHNADVADDADDESDAAAGSAQLLVARDGRCQPGDAARFDAAGVFEGRLGADDFRAAGVDRVAVTLFWREAALDRLAAQSRRLDASLSWTVQRAWILAKSAPARIYPTVQAELSGGGHRRQWIYMGLDMFAEVSAQAAREDRSMSKVVAEAVMRAWPFLSKLARRE
jgi:hypothetical protein